MKDSILIKGGTVIDPASGTQKVQDVRISQGMVSALDANLSANDGDTIFDATGLWVCPGLIDIHTHLRDLGQKDKEDIETGTRAAAAGGYTTVVAMANTDPPMDNGQTLQVWLSRIASKALVEVLPVAAVTKGLAGLELTNMYELSDLGAVAFSDDGMNIMNLAVLRRALEYARLTGRVVISHAEDHNLSAGGVIHEGKVSTCMGLHGIPAASETAAVAREIEIVRQTNAAYHFTHLSCAQSIALVKRAKEDGLPITADVTPHHLTLSVDDIEGFDTNYKMKPPLRTVADQEALFAGIKEGVVDAIATDHAPHTRMDKGGTMEESAVGIVGLETAFSLCYEKLVAQGGLKPIDFIALLTTKPAALLGLPVPWLSAEGTANLAIFDPQLKWTFNARAAMSRSSNSPYHSRQMVGKNLLTIFNGKPVYKDEEQIARRRTDK